LERFIEAIKKYFDIYKVDNNIDLIELSSLSKPDFEKMYFKCIADYIEPAEKWKKSTKGASPLAADKCVMCHKQLKEILPFMDTVCKSIEKKEKYPYGPLTCSYCYWYCAQELFKERSPLKLKTKKVVRKRKKLNT
jgi:hypothetical protein